MNEIPVEQPSLRFEAEVPRAFYTYDRPVIGHGLVLAAGSWGQHLAGDPPPVLTALDAETGSERFRVHVPVRRSAATECQVALPAFLPDGRILLAVYQWDVSLAFYVIDGTGRILREYVQEEQPDQHLHIKAFDSGIKLWMERIAVTGDAFSMSWVYRGRSYQVQCRSIETGAVRWSAPERLLGALGGVAVTESDPPRKGRVGSSIAGRAIADGTERWRHPAIGEQAIRTCSAIGVTSDAIVLVDRTAQAEHRLARAEGVLDLAVATESDDFDALERRWDADHEAPGAALVGVDPATGNERFRTVLAGMPMSMACAPPHAAVVVVGNDGVASLVVLRADGEPSGAPTRLHHAKDTPPVIVAIDETSLLLLFDRELLCSPIADPSHVAWRLALPERVDSEPHLVGDRGWLHEPAIALADGRIHLRAQGKLWCFG